MLSILSMLVFDLLHFVTPCLISRISLVQLEPAKPDQEALQKVWNEKQIRKDINLKSTYL